MRLNSNPLSMNTLRNMQITSNGAAQAMRRLSSGKKINKASDDAAGYAISEKMHMQATGLARGSKNSLDGVSMVQTAEAALNEVHSMLQRMRELAVQASNDTMKQEDRQAVQTEIDNLTSEINRIGDSTEFNKIKIFSSDNEDATTKSTMNISVQSGANSNQMIDLPFEVISSSSLGISSVHAGSQAFDIEKVSVSSSTGDTVDKTTGIPTAPMYVNGAKYTANNPLENQSIKDRHANNQPKTDARGNFIYKKEYALDVSTHTAATTAISVYDNAMSKLSHVRATLGAAQNRLESTVRSLDSAEENITESMSRIQDASLAEEMSEFTKYNVMQQAGASMLQQSNQMPQMILKLLED